MGRDDFGTRGGRGRFTRGGGRYVSDLALEDEALAVGFLRSTSARAHVTAIDLGAVREATGVVAAFSYDDLSPYIRPLPVRYGPGHVYSWNLLARDVVSYVGEPLAVIVGRDRATVEEAIELAEVQYEPLQAVVDVEAARRDEPGVVRPEIGTNVVFSTDRQVGDVAAALHDAFRVVERRYHLGRHSACPLENRGVVAYVDRLTKELVVCSSTQVPHVTRKAVSTVLGRRESTVRVVVPDVGGAFGVKAQVGQEECLVACVAQVLGRRVAWIEDRFENLAASTHAHDEWVRLAVGFTRDGEITAVDAEVVVDVGAHSTYPLSYALEPSSVSGHLFGCYRVPVAQLSAVGVATNKCPTGSYRGVGASVASFATERLLDDAAHELGIGRIDIRRRNLLSAADMPYRHPFGGEMDSGSPAAVFNRLVDSLEPGGTVLRALAGGASSPRHEGVGIAMYNEHSGPGSAVYRRRGVAEVAGYDTARVAFSDDGTFSVFISSADAGQSHATVCRTQVATELGVDPDVVDVVEGDTSSCPVGTGTFASRFAVRHIGAALAAASKMGERLRAAAAIAMACSPEEVQRSPEGGFESAAGGAKLSLEELATWFYQPPSTVRDRVGELPVEELGFSDDESAVSFGAMVAELDVDPETFVTSVRALRVVEDCGRVLDRDLVTRQLVGGAVMGVGDSVLEEHHYDDVGEILTSSFMDYVLPSVLEAPVVTVDLLEDESLYSTRSWTGSKGVGEAGVIGAVAAIGCAASDALSLVGASLDELPATPLRLYRAWLAGSDGRRASPSVE